MAHFLFQETVTQCLVNMFYSYTNIKTKPGNLLWGVVQPWTGKRISVHFLALQKTSCELNYVMNERFESTFQPPGFYHFQMLE